MRRFGSHDDSRRDLVISRRVAVGTHPIRGHRSLVSHVPSFRPFRNDLLRIRQRRVAPEHFDVARRLGPVTNTTKMILP